MIHSISSNEQRPAAVNGSAPAIRSASSRDLALIRYMLRARSVVGPLSRTLPASRCSCIQARWVARVTVHFLRGMKGLRWTREATTILAQTHHVFRSRRNLCLKANVLLELSGGHNYGACNLLVGAVQIGRAHV